MFKPSIDRLLGYETRPERVVSFRVCKRWAYPAVGGAPIGQLVVTGVDREGGTITFDRPITRWVSPRVLKAADALFQHERQKRERVSTWHPKPWWSPQ